MRVLKQLSFCWVVYFCLAATGPVAAEAKNAAAGTSLEAILAAQPADAKARYGARRPAETLEFCEIKRGDVVIETLPGGGWYSRILYPYIGETGKLIGAHYPKSLFERIGLDEDRIKSLVERDANWSKTTAKDPVAKGGEIDSFTMTKMPEQFSGVADKVLYIRSLHNLARFNDETGDLDAALREAFRSLKPGGIVCIVQHRAQEETSDRWADGSNGYLKQSKVIAALEGAGFKFVKASEINANPKDRPSETDKVWRLPPNLRGPEEGSDQWKKNKEIGESDRMTLKFVKPAR